MKALSKDQEKEKVALIDSIRDAHAALEASVITYNAAMEKEQREVRSKLVDLNEKLQEAKGWAEGLAGDMQNYYDERSENWQEGDNGQNYDAWKSEYENFSPDDLEIDFHEDLEVPECTGADDLETLPDEP